MKYAPNLIIAGICLAITMVCCLVDYYIYTPNEQGWLSGGPFLFTGFIFGWAVLASVIKPGKSKPSSSAGKGLYVVGLPAVFLVVSPWHWPNVSASVVATVALTLLCGLLVLFAAGLVFGSRRASRRDALNPIA